MTEKTDCCHFESAELSVRTLDIGPISLAHHRM